LVFGTMAEATQNMRTSNSPRARQAHTKETCHPHPTKGGQ
jgi:hypothetical protein